jgi:hypothetical protein
LPKKLNAAAKKALKEFAAQSDTDDFRSEMDASR